MSGLGLALSATFPCVITIYRESFISPRMVPTFIGSVLPCVVVVLSPSSSPRKGGGGAPARTACPPDDHSGAISWSLPGHGSPYASCGKWAWHGHEAGASWHVRSHKVSCDRPLCPTCYESWAAREAARAEERVIEGMRRVRRKAVHWTLGPERALWPRFDTQDGYREMRAWAERIALAAGWRGGALVYHHVRLGSERWRHPGYEPCGHMHPGPHFHLVGDGWLHKPFAGTKQYARGSRVISGGGDLWKWNVENLGVRQSVRQTILYLLSHCGLGYAMHVVQRDLTEGSSPIGNPSDKPRLLFATVTWFGSMSSLKLRLPMRVESLWCPLCEAEVPLRGEVELEWCGQGPPPEPESKNEFFEGLLGCWRLVGKSELYERQETYGSYTLYPRTFYSQPAMRIS